MSDEAAVWEDPNELTQAQRIYHLRRSGMSFPEIAKMVDREHQVNWIMEMYRAYATQLSQQFTGNERRMLAQIELDRLDALQFSWWEMAQLDDKAAGVVLKVMAMRQKLLQLDMPDPSDRNVQQTVLVIGNDKQEWMAALEHGRNLHSRGRDDEDEAEEE